MAYKPFKMRGSPMKRNLGVGASPAKAEGVVDPDANVARATTTKTPTGPYMKSGSPAKRKHNLKPADIDKGGREAAFKPDTNVMRKTGSPAKKGKKSRGKTKRRDHTNPLYDISPI